MSFAFKIFLPLRKFLEETVDQAILSAQAGQVTVMSHHAPYVFHLLPGFITLKRDEKRLGEKIFVCEGLARVGTEGELVVFAQDAVFASQADEAYLKERIDFYQQKLDDEGEDAKKIELNDKIFALRSLLGVA